MPKFVSTSEKDLIRKQLLTELQSWLAHKGPGKEVIHTYTLPASQWSLELDLVQLAKSLPNKQFFFHCCENNPDTFWSNQLVVQPKGACAVQRVSANVTAQYELGDFERVMHPEAVYQAPWWANSERSPVSMFVWADYCGLPTTERIDHLSRFSHSNNLVGVTFECKWRTPVSIPAKLLSSDVCAPGRGGQSKVDTSQRAHNTHKYVWRRLRRASPDLFVATKLDLGYKSDHTPMYTGLFHIHT